MTKRSRRTYIKYFIILLINFTIMAGPEQKNQIDNNESLRELARALGQNPDTQEKFWKQVATTNVAKRAEEYKNWKEEQAFVQTRNYNSASGAPSNREPIKTDKTTSQETSHKIVPLPNDSNNPDRRLAELRNISGAEKTIIKNSIVNIQTELNNSNLVNLSKIISNPQNKNIPLDFPIQIPQNCHIKFPDNQNLRWKIIAYSDLKSIIKPN